MRDIHIKYYWIGRILASDPGLIRLNKAGRSTISLMASIFTTLFVLRESGNALLTPAIVSGLVGMLAIMIVMDDTKKKMKITTLLLGVSAITGVTFGSLLAGHSYYVDALMLFLIFCSFYFSQFGVRYFSLFLMGFLTVYFSFLLNLSSNQLLWFYLGITIGTAYAYVLNFIIFQDTAKILKRSIRSFHIQGNLTLNMVIKAMRDQNLTPKGYKHLQGNVLKLRDYAIIVSEYINEEDVQEIWPGLKAAQLRLYIFDTGMLIETLADSLQSLKNAEAFKNDELRRLLIWVTESLRNAEVLAENYQEQNLAEAEHAVQALRLIIIELFQRDQQPEGWLFLIRRIESIANHIIEGAITIQHSLHVQKIAENHMDEPNTESSINSTASVSSKEKIFLNPSTKKAFQSLVAGIISIIIGQIISPNQPYWVLLTAYIVFLGTESIGRIYTKAFQRSVGTIFGAVIGFMMAKLITNQPVIEVLLLFLVVFLAFYFFTISYTLMSFFITILIAFMYDLLLGGITYSLIEARVLDTIAGAAIAFGVSTIVFPKKTKDKVVDSANDFLIELKSYVMEYVRSFREDVNVKELSKGAFLLDQKLQTIKAEAHSLVQRPGSPDHSEITRWITVFTAMNYYAKHLVASSYRKGFDYPEELVDVFKQIEEKLDQNIKSLIEMIKGSEHDIKINSLDTERERIERLAPSGLQHQRDLIHHLYYVWRINQAIVQLTIKLGTGEK